MHAVSSNVMDLPAPPSDTTVRVLLARHGQTAWNREHRFLGRTDVPLDEVGREQARRLAGRLAATELTAIYSSPLRRAVDTARAVAARRSLEVRLEPRLVELAQGDLEGRPAAVLPERHPDFLARWLRDPTDARIPGGEETLGECQARGLAALRGLIARSGPGAVVLLVSHQLVIASVLCALTDRPLRRFRDLHHRNAAMSVLDATGDRIQVTRVNDGAHLAEAST